MSASPMKPNVNNEANVLQRRIFSRWCNQKLNTTKGRPVKDVVDEIGDGVLLIWLLEVLSETTMPDKYEAAPKNRIAKIDK
jgi:hypothetical protein